MFWKDIKKNANASNRFNSGILPEALRTKCARCSSQQYEGGLRVITKLYYDYPLQYNRLKSKWDPTGEYHRRFEEYLRGLQFNVINSESTTREPKCLFYQLIWSFMYYALLSLIFWFSFLFSSKQQNHKPTMLQILQRAKRLLLQHHRIAKM